MSMLTAGGDSGFGRVNAMGLKSLPVGIARREKGKKNRRYARNFFSADESSSEGQSRRWSFVFVPMGYEGK